MDANNNDTVSLAKLRQGDDESVQVACHALQRNGFVFLDFSNDVLSNMTDDLKEAAIFLEQHAGQGSTESLHGHVSNKFKDSLRILTGNQYDASSLPIDVSNLASEMDNAAVAIAVALFECDSVHELGEAYDLPLLIKKEDDSMPSYGLLDIVHYHNDDEEAPELVVSAHRDPGLFILSLPQNAPGLELQDCHGQWHEPPEGLGVLWMGAAAAHVAMPCTHRIRTHLGTPRVACWHEICTSSQIAQPMLDRLRQEGKEMKMGSIVGTKKVLASLRQAENHETNDDKHWYSPFLPKWGRLRIIEVKPASPPGVSMLKVEQATFSIPVRTGQRENRFPSLVNRGRQQQQQ